MTLAFPLSQLNESEIDWLHSAPLSEVYSYLTRREGKRSGKDIKFLCSNHNDTDPSLFIDDQKGVGHCFGCDWKFNRWSLLRESGFAISKPQSNYRAQHRNIVSREIEALNQLGRQSEAEKLETCATKFEVRKCQDCKARFTISYHCDHRLCPTCNRRHIRRFLGQHKSNLDFRLEPWGVTIALPGRPLANNGQEPIAELRALIEEARKILAQVRRKYQPVGLFQHMIVVRQLTIRNGIAYLKINLLIDCMRKDVEVLRGYLASRYRWSPVRAVREFLELNDAIDWLRNKAARPLEAWETVQDLEVWLLVTKHMPLIYGVGNFRKVKGGRCKGKLSPNKAEPIPCPFCGSTNTLTIGVVPKEEAWLWDKRLSPPSVIRTDNEVPIPAGVSM